jgi:hypothetical protein
MVYPERSRSNRVGRREHGARRIEIYSASVVWRAESVVWRAGSEKMKELIAKIRQEIGRGIVPTADVLRLCERAEETLAVTLRLEKALHDALKIIEQRDKKG